MDQWIADLTTEVLWAKDVGSAQAGLRRLAKQAGIDHFAYGRLAPSKGGDVSYMDTTYASEWIDHYLGNNLVTYDPVVAEAMRSPLPFAWRLLPERTALNAPQRQLLADAADFGLRDGLTIPFHGKAGCTGLMSLAFDSTAGLQEALAAQPSLRLLGQYYNAALDRLLDDNVLVSGLSRLERDCLTWTAAGNGQWDISATIHRSLSEVAAALRSASRTLGAATTSQAVAIAIAQGLITP
jgi:LuxR family transcriptional regulator, activator of conjugal transfer of Ti plasmids